MAGFDKHDRGAFNADPATGAWPVVRRTGADDNNPVFAMKIQRYMHDYGISENTLARVAEKPLSMASEPQCLAPHAGGGGDIAGAIMVNNPLTKYMFCFALGGRCGAGIVPGGQGEEHCSEAGVPGNRVLKSRRYGFSRCSHPARRYSRRRVPRWMPPAPLLRWRVGPRTSM